MRVGDCDLTFAFGAPNGKKGIGMHASLSNFYDVEEDPTKEAKLTTEFGCWAHSDHADWALSKVSGREFQPELVDKPADKLPKPAVAAVEAPAEPVAEAA